MSLKTYILIAAVEGMVEGRSRIISQDGGELLNAQEAGDPRSKIVSPNKGKLEHFGVAR